MHRILICGSRDWIDKQVIMQHIMAFHEIDGVQCVIEGGARGADRLGREVAEELKIPVITEPADWDKYGKMAGPIRNQAMINKHNPTFCLAYPLPQSRGTLDMITRCKRANIAVRVWRSNGPIHT
jgi:hypothetical protein